MRIAMFSKQASPYAATDSRAGDIRSLAEALTDAGATVHLIVPVSARCDFDDSSLARRLAPVRVEGAEIGEWHQFEKSESRGFHLHLLQPKHKGAPEESLAQDGARAADALIASMSEPPEWILSCDEDNELADVLLAKSEHTTPFFSFITDRFASKEGLARSVELADAIAVCGSWAYQLASMDAVPDLPSRLEDGSLVIERPPYRSTRAQAPAFRASAKASLQLSLGLPVNGDVPLLFVDDEVLAHRLELLRDLLLMNIQIIATRAPDKSAVDIDQFKDRFAVTRGETDDLLCAADGCLVWQDARLVASALHLGAVPIATPHAGADLVDIEPNLRSGSGFISVDDSVTGLKVAVERFAAAKARHLEFDTLAKRLPTYSRSWTDVALHCMQLMGSPTIED